MTFSRRLRRAPVRAARDSPLTDPAHPDGMRGATIPPRQTGGWRRSLPKKPPDAPALTLTRFVTFGQPFGCPSSQPSDVTVRTAVPFVSSRAERAHESRATAPCDTFRPKGRTRARGFPRAALGGRDNPKVSTAPSPTIPARQLEAGGEVVPAAQLRTEARRLGVSQRLRRLGSEGLLAPPTGAGRGRGRGRRAYTYPGHALEQLAAIAAALPHGHRYVALRHRIWWSPTGRLEDWELWRRDRLDEVAGMATAWDLPAAVNGELPEERERHMVEVAEQLLRLRVPGMPRKTLRSPEEAQTYVRLFTSALFRDDLLDPGDGPEPTWAHVRETAQQAVDENGTTSVTESLGALFERGSSWPHRPFAGVSPGVAALACAHYVPTPRLAVATLLTMTEERATVLRDAVMGGASLVGTADILRDQPVGAAMALVTWELLASAHPSALEVPDRAP
jgi:hypothetical protein